MLKVILDKKRLFKFTFIMVTRTTMMARACLLDRGSSLEVIRLYPKNKRVAPSNTYNPIVIESV
jgi:hypothetical protein